MPGRMDVVRRRPAPTTRPIVEAQLRRARGAGGDAPPPRHATVEALRQRVDTLDIPAFLRKQAD
jgi:hypothetical protein